MYHFFVKPEQIGPGEIYIEGTDVNHIRNVLRMNIGEQITVSSGEEQKEYRCQLLQIEENCITAKIMWVEASAAELPSKICLFQGLPKSDKMELIIQKAVELGVSEIVPMATRRAVVKLDKKKEEAKRKRWTAIAESAAKQSKRMIVPEILPVMSFAKATAYAKSFDVRMIPYEMAGGMETTREMISCIRPGQSVAVLIGPEGGFDESEIALAKASAITPVTLGKRILRTETAGMTILSVLMFHLEE